MRTARTLIASLSSTRGLHRHLPCCSLAARHGIYVYRSTLDYYLDYVVFRALLTCTACTFSVSPLWISSLTVHLICTACTIISWSNTTTSSSGYMGYDYCVEFVRYYYQIGYFHMEYVCIFSSSSRRGFALWASAVDAHLFFVFVPFPTERLRTVCHTPV